MLLKGLAVAIHQPMNEPAHDPLLAAIALRREQDPLIGAKIGAAELRRRLLEVMATDRGVHVESLLAVCGALAGQACQASLRACARAQGREETAGLHRLATESGGAFLVGESLSQALFGGAYSPWSLAAGAAEEAGCRDFPDPAELLRHGMESLGEEAFGVPQVPHHHRPSPESLQLLPVIWPVLLPLAQRLCPDPAEWPILFGLLAQQVITMGKDVIDPCLALRIVMDTAIANAMVILPQLPASTPSS
jgi:hypothetical protein